MMLTQQFFADQTDGALACVENRYVQQRHAEFQRIGGRQLRGGDELFLREPLRERLLGGCGLGHCIASSGFIQRAILYQTAGYAGDSDQVSCSSSVH